MKVQPINNYTGSYSRYKSSNNKNTAFYSQNTPSFKGRFLDKSIFSWFNPGHFYMKKMFQLSVAVSRRTWTSIKPNLKPYTKSKILKAKDGTETIAWDINKHNRKKYVIVLHGLSHNISSLQDLYSGILDNTKYAILAPEYHGLQKGNHDKVNPYNFVKDVDTGLNYLNKKGIKSKNIVVLGHSMGGYVAGKLAENHKDLSKLILVAPINSLGYEATKIKNKKRRILPDYKISGFFVKNVKKCREPFSGVFRTGELLEKVSVPTDIIHSKHDGIIKRDDVIKMATSCKNLNGLHLLDSGSHRMDEDKINQVIEILQ